MAEQTYTLPAKPVYHKNIRKLQRQDPANAESVFNPLIQAMLENTEFVRLLAEAIAAQNTADHAAIRQEAAQSIGAAIAAIPTPDVSGQIAVHNEAGSAHAALFQALGDALAQVKTTAEGHTHAASGVGALPISGGTLTGNLRLKGTGNYGMVLNLGDGDYVHVSEPQEDILELKGKSIRFVTTQASGSPLPINQGGTGATSASGVRSAIGAASASHTHSLSSLGAASASHTHSASQLGVTPISLMSYVPSSLSNNQVALVYV